MPSHNWLLLQPPQITAKARGTKILSEKESHKEDIIKKIA